MGGRGKTPTVAYVSGLLVGAGERPAILSRGYARRRPEEGVVVVSDGHHLRADIDRAGDEPLMLARQVRGAAVLVCEVRAMAAALAETTIGATIHVLDDGFQHRSLARDVDIVIVSAADLRDRPLPFGRLRSPVASLRQAHAVVIDDREPERARELLASVIDPRRTAIFELSRRLGTPWWLGTETRPVPRAGESVVAVAGIAGPERFGRALEAAGFQVAELVGFRDHHSYRRGDIERIAAVAADRPVVTTEKDAMRLLPWRPLPVATAAVPLSVVVEPARDFEAWLTERLAEVRA